MGFDRFSGIDLESQRYEYSHRIRQWLVWHAHKLANHFVENRHSEVMNQSPIDRLWTESSGKILAMDQKFQGLKIHYTKKLLLEISRLTALRLLLPRDQFLGENTFRIWWTVSYLFKYFPSKLFLSKYFRIWWTLGRNKWWTDLI